MASIDKAYQNNNNVNNTKLRYVSIPIVLLVSKAYYPYDESAARFFMIYHICIWHV